VVTNGDPRKKAVCPRCGRPMRKDPHPTEHVEATRMAAPQRRSSGCRLPKTDEPKSRSDVWFRKWGYRG
jgi:hypothetical protein